MQASSTPTRPRTAHVAASDKTDARPAGFDNLLDSAANLFARFGLDGASLRDIGRESGVAAPLICYHFENKHNLYLEAFAHKSEQTIDFISDQVASCAEPSMRFRTLVNALYDLLISEPELTALLQRDIIDATLCRGDLLSKHFYKHFIVIIRRAASEFAHIEISERTSFSVMSLVLGYCLLSNVRVLANSESRVDAIQADRDALADEALKLVGV